MPETPYKNRLDYIRSIFAPETAALKKARESGGVENDRIAIHSEEGKFLQFLIHAIQAKTVVEIGTLHGYSALWMAEALPEDGKIITIEKDEARAKTAHDNTAHNPKIRLMQGNALNILPTLQGVFDMVFIDADKVNYLHYLDWAEKNIRKGGLIVGDNTLLFDAVWKDEPIERVRDTARAAMRAFNRRLADPEKYTGIMLPTHEGLTVAVKLF